ncbi:hypothetical protein PLICBS_001564 [Purpureocillium lilacinum]|uniref:uncharacterized protein n=1 Tax=Purpureocillium lilacinum TaxID=33203 RepID=UPI002081A52D|nr:hypothetical protein PLICBS_001564 [Purpureocillium lilacinum]
MSFSDSFQPAGQQHPSGAQSSSAGLSINLSSNNPFRNRAASPSSIEAAFASPASPFDDPPRRPLSRNPFLDQAQPPLKSPGAMSSRSETKSLSAEDIFDSLTLDDKTAAPAAPAATRQPMDRQPATERGESQPPSNGNHRPTRSQEEALRARKPPPAGAARPPGESPQRKPQRRPRRNSESSVINSLTAEEMKMIEAKRLRDKQRREREGRSSGREGREGQDSREAKEGRDGKDGKETREGKDRTRSGRPSRRLDIIDQLDATSIYGTGLFHHDGPFDALNPHRNRKSSRRAPMHAFPKDSLNNSLGGAGPLNANPDHAVFMGNATDEAFRDYAGGAKNKNGYNYPSPASRETAIFDPIARGSVVHGDESVGLGTSTFLEGTPAARAAIARRQAEQAQESFEVGIQRKKSLAQRIRHINRGPRDITPSGRLTNPDGAYGKRSPDGMATGTSVGSDNNPFFAEFSKGEETLSVKPRDGTLSPTSPPPPVPRRGSSGGPLERRATTDATMSEEAPPIKPTGILGRMKSLKGGRRPKNIDHGSVPGAAT